MSNVIEFSSSVSREAHARKPRATVPTEIILDDRPSAGSATAGNGRLREERREIWRMAEAATRYWKVRLDFEDAVERAQHMGTPEGRSHPAVNPDYRRPLVGRWRAALVKQLLTPAWDVASVKWKQMALARGEHRYTDVKPERIERAIAADFAFLAAHPIRRGMNSETLARRRSFKEAMRQRIRDISRIA